MINWVLIRWQDEVVTHVVVGGVAPGYFVLTTDLTRYVVLTEHQEEEANLQDAVICH